MKRVMNIGRRVRNFGVASSRRSLFVPRTKYGSRWTICRQNHKHQSKKEAIRCNHLHLLQMAGEIKDLETQSSITIFPSFTYRGKTIRKTTYRADFRYFDRKRGVSVIEDVKGVKTALYSLKKKLLLYTLKDEVFIET